jgi:hypothetical protein
MQSVSHHSSFCSPKQSSGNQRPAFHSGLSRWRQQLAATLARFRCSISPEFISVVASFARVRRGFHRQETGMKPMKRCVSVTAKRSGFNATAWLTVQIQCHRLARWIVPFLATYGVAIKGLPLACRGDRSAFSHHQNRWSPCTED